VPTPNVNIYTRAINEFDDYRINTAYSNNYISFFKIMYNYLDNAIPLFNIPKIMINKLLDRVKPIDTIELFDGDGHETNFVLTSIPTLDAYFYYIIDNITVDGTYDSLTNSITLNTVAPLGTENITIEWYDSGSFNETLSEREERILSYLLVQNWGEKEKNFLLDIRRLLNDTDFKLSAESTNMREKGNWYHSMREHAVKDMKQYSWDLTYDDLKKKYGLA